MGIVYENNASMQIVCTVVLSDVSIYYLAVNIVGVPLVLDVTIQLISMV